jgi:hypothetical protein
MRAVGELLGSSTTTPSDVRAAPPPSAAVTLAPEPEPTPLSAPAPAPEAAAESAPAPEPAVESMPKAETTARAPVERRPRPSPGRHRTIHARAATEAQRGSECSQGQRRCSGTVLQLCNASLDGWTDFIDCGENAVCDATTTGHGPCVPLPTRDSDDQ